MDTTTTLPRDRQDRTARLTLFFSPGDQVHQMVLHIPHGITLQKNVVSVPQFIEAVIHATNVRRHLLLDPERTAPLTREPRYRVLPHRQGLRDPGAIGLCQAVASNKEVHMVIDSTTRKCCQLATTKSPTG